MALHVAAQRSQQRLVIVVVEVVVDQPAVVAQVIEVEALDQLGHRHLVGVREERAREGVEHELQAVGQLGVFGELGVGDRVPAREGGGGIVAEQGLHLGPDLAARDLPKVVDPVARERDQVDHRRGRDVLERVGPAVGGQDQVVADVAIVAVDAERGEQLVEVVVVVEERVEAVLHADLAAVGHRGLPGPDLAAEVLVALEQHDREPALGQLGRGAHAREPGSDHGDPARARDGRRQAAIDRREQVLVAAEAALDQPVDQPLWSSPPHSARP